MGKQQSRQQAKIVYLKYDQPVAEKELIAHVDSESSFWQDVSKAMFTDEIHDASGILVCLDKEGDKMQYASIQISTDEITGRRRIRPDGNRIRLPESKYTRTYLRKIDGETNTRAWYDIIPQNLCGVTCEVGAEFGLIGSVGMDSVEDGDVLTPPYAGGWFYWPLYYYKTGVEGYDDMTDLIEDDDEEEAEETAEEETVVEDILSAKAVLAANITDASKKALCRMFSEEAALLTGKAKYNARQISSCEKIYAELLQETKIDKVNKLIEKSIAVMKPTDFAKGVTIKDFLVPKVEDEEEQAKLLEKAYDEMQTRINIMRNMSAGSLSKASEENDGKAAKADDSLFGDVDIAYATPEEKKKVMDLINPGARSKVTNIFMCTPHKQEEVYNAFCTKRGIDKTKLLFHGSLTENIASLIHYSLQIRPTAANGRMFGNGVYLAHDFMKSYGYTSIVGSRWTNGTSRRGYILVFEMASGKEYQPDGYSANRSHFCREWIDSNGYDSLHAVAHKVGLMADEYITFYNEAVCIRAVIEFEE